MIDYKIYLHSISYDNIRIIADGKGGRGQSAHQQASLSNYKNKMNINAK